MIVPYWNFNFGNGNPLETFKDGTENENCQTVSPENARPVVNRVTKTTKMADKAIRNTMLKFRAPLMK